MSVVRKVIKSLALSVFFIGSSAHAASTLSSSGFSSGVSLGVTGVTKAVNADYIVNVAEAVSDPAGAPGNATSCPMIFAEYTPSMDNRLYSGLFSAYAGYVDAPSGLGFNIEFQANKLDMSAKNGFSVIAAQALPEDNLRVSAASLIINGEYHGSLGCGASDGSSSVTGIFVSLGGGIMKYYDVDGVFAVGTDGALGGAAGDIAGPLTYDGKSSLIYTAKAKIGAEVITAGSRAWGVNLGFAMNSAANEIELSSASEGKIYTDTFADAEAATGPVAGTIARVTSVSIPMVYSGFIEVRFSRFFGGEDI